MTSGLESLGGFAAAAAAVGPFAHTPFLEAMWRHSAAAEDRLEVVAGDRGALALWHRQGRIELVGHEDLVDYRSPVGEPVEILAKALADAASGTAYRFDSLPVEAASIVAAALELAGLESSSTRHEATAVLALPATMDEYLASLSKKERHETRRKIRRFEAGCGEARLVSYDRPGPALKRFFGLHRLADGSKSAFMTPSMARLFRSLLELDGWQVDALYGDETRPIALAVGYVDTEGHYLYNSAYDPSRRDVSPGVVLLMSMLERAMADGLTVFDFLKGDEAYKYRMGATARPLYVFEGST